MNEFVRLADWRRNEVTDENDLIALAMELSEVPTSPLYTSHVSPDRALAAAVRERL